MNTGRSALITLMFLAAAGFSAAGEIHTAVSRMDRLGVEKILLKTPEAAKAVEPGNVTPLHVAAARDYDEIARMLTAAGADLNARSEGGFTPLHWAARKNSDKTARLLIEKGADPALRENSGMTPLDVAVRSGSDRVVTILKAASAARAGGGARPAKVPSVKPEDVRVKFQGKVQSKFYTDIDKSGEGEADQALDSLARLESKLDFHEIGAVFFLSGDVRSMKFDLDKPDSSTEALLREAYCENRTREYAFSFGRQIVTWGKLDEIVILDRISPQDYDWFVLNDKADRKQPVTMFKAEYYWKDSQLEAIFIPKHEPAKLRYFGTDWSYFGHLKEVAAAGPYPQQVKDAVNLLNVDQDQVPNEPEFAVRLRTKLLDTDFGFYGMSLFDRMPGLKEQTPNGALVKSFLFAPSAETMQRLMGAGLTPQDLTFKDEYKRNTVVGVDFETVAGEYGIRGECAFLSGQPLNRSDFKLIRKDMISAGVGVDHTTQSDVYLNLQALTDYILDYEPLFETEELAHQLVLNVNRDFLLGDLHASARMVYHITYRDWMLNPLCSYKFGHGVEVETGAFFFAGDPWTLLGRFDTKDLAYVELLYRF